MKLYQYSINLKTRIIEEEEIEARETEKWYIADKHFQSYRGRVSKEKVENHGVTKGFSYFSVLYTSPNLEEAAKVLFATINEEGE